MAVSKASTQTITLCPVNIAEHSRSSSPPETTRKINKLMKVFFNKTCQSFIFYTFFSLQVFQNFCLRLLKHQSNKTLKFYFFYSHIVQRKRNKTTDMDDKDVETILSKLRNQLMKSNIIPDQICLFLEQRRLISSQDKASVEQSGDPSAKMLILLSLITHNGLKGYNTFVQALEENELFLVACHLYKEGR